MASLKSAHQVGPTMATFRKNGARTAFGAVLAFLHLSSVVEFVNGAGEGAQTRDFDLDKKL